MLRMRIRRLPDQQLADMKDIIEKEVNRRLDAKDGTKED